MQAHQYNGAHAPGLSAPQSVALNDETPGVAAEGFKGQGKNEKPDFHRSGHAGQALRVISAENQARVYLARLLAQQAAPDELAALVATQRDAVALVGFCRVIEKALGRNCHGAWPVGRAG